MNTTTAPLNAGGWDRPILQQQVLRRRRDGHSEIGLRVGALRTPYQALHIERAIGALPGVLRVTVQPPAQRVRVVLDPEQTSLPDLLAAFAAINCPAQPLSVQTLDDPRRREAHVALKRLLVAGFSGMQAMMYAAVLYVGAFGSVDGSTRDLFRWLGLLAATPVVWYSALPFFTGALHDLRTHRLGTDVPVALAIAAIYTASVIAAVQSNGEVYFDSVSMLVFFLLGGRYLALRAGHLNGARSDAAADAMPATATRRRMDGALETVAAIELEVGDQVQVADGATVPADSILENVSVKVDESLLSGESRPLTRHRGDCLRAGSIIVTGPALMRVERSSAASTWAELSRLAARTQAARRPVRPADDRDAARFVRRVLALAALTAAGWLWFDPTRAFDAVVAVLVVACPCAFALAAPATLARALGALARRGVLVANADALAVLARVNHVLFDKTGTLTEPRIDVAAIEPLRELDADHVLRLAAALACSSTHPVSRALAASTDSLELPPATALRAVAGAGIEGNVKGHWLRLGRADFALSTSASAHATDDTPLMLADTTGALAIIHVTERLRDDACASLDALHADGIAATLASGDTPVRAAAIATRLGIADWHARQSPSDKLQRLAALHRAGKVVLAVGDGSNDAPVLAAADVSATLAGGSDLAQANADLLLVDGRLQGLPAARHIARQVQYTLSQNRRWALAYNLCAAPFAALGFVPPWLAAIGMAASSLVVVLNAMRIGRNGRFALPPAAAPQEQPA